MRDPDVQRIQQGVLQLTGLANTVALERDQLKVALNRMVLAHENTESDSEGRWPQPDIGCIECTVGTVPDRLNTGLCAYHNAKKLLGQI